MTQDTRNNIRRTMMPQSLQSRRLGTSHSSPSTSSTIQNTLQNSLIGIAINCSIVFSKFKWQSEISSLSKVILVLGKSQKFQDDKSASLVGVWIKSLAPAGRCSFCSGSRSHEMNSATTYLMPKFYVKISDTAVLESPDQLLVLTLSVTDLCRSQPVHV